MSDPIEPDVYPTFTPFGRVDALFDDGAGVRLVGPDDAVAAVRRVIAQAVSGIGMSLSPENIEPADYVSFCQPPGSGILILEPPEVTMGAAALALAPEDVAEPVVALDGVADIPGLRSQFGGAAGALAKLTLAKAIAAARREDEPAGLSKEEQKAIADTIYRQLGGRRFITMTGARDFLSLGEASGAPMGGIRFSLPTGLSQIDGKSTGINRVTIKLNASDTYDIEFGGARGTSYTVRKTVEDIYADGLQEVFTRYTGMDTSLGSGGPGAFATKPVSRREARDAYDELSYAISDLQGHTDMELARPGSTDRIERAVERARQLEAGWPKDELQPRGIIETAEALIDRAQELRREGGLTEVSAGDVKSYVLSGTTLTEAQRQAVLAKTSRVIKSGAFDVPRYNLAEVQAMVKAFEAENARAAAPTITAERISGDLDNHGGFALIVNGERREFVGAEPEDLTDQASDLAAARGIGMNEAIAELAVRNGWDQRAPMPGPAPVLKRPTVQEAKAAGRAAFAAGLKAVPALDPAVSPMMARVGSDATLGRKLLEAWMRGWTEANLEAPVPDGNLAPGGARFRYALMNRPADFATLPNGLVYNLLPRPAPGQPHHAMARHGIIETDRELTESELKSFELAPLIDGAALDQLAERIADAMRENAAAWVEEAGDAPDTFRAAVLQAVETGQSGISYSVGDPDALVAGVLARLRAMAGEATTGGGAPGAEQGARDADLALLAQIEAGQHPAMLDPALADLIEAALMRHPDDAEVQAAGERAAVAYANAIVAATG